MTSAPSNIGRTVSLIVVCVFLYIFFFIILNLLCA